MPKPEDQLPYSNTEEQIGFIISNQNTDDSVLEGWAAVFDNDIKRFETALRKVFEGVPGLPLKSFDRHIKHANDGGTKALKRLEEAAKMIKKGQKATNIKDFVSPQRAKAYTQQIKEHKGIIVDIEKRRQKEIARIKKSLASVIEQAKKDLDAFKLK
jgi:hypothetical protein